MPRDAADQALQTLRDPAAPSASDRYGQHIFRPSGLMISIGSTRGALESVEFSRPVTAADTVRFKDVDVFRLPAREVVRRMRRHTTVLEDEDDPASFVAPGLLLSFWRSFEADDDPDDEQGHYFATVLLARPGYYDTPAQAQARLAEQASGNTPAPTPEQMSERRSGGAGA
ncbi:hypothetical protein [Streptomyces flavofungini]|uniref:hypothetical protein n=1 Tax=Streptomyces flavofungini TaxID=68200 RepID=UPI0034E00A6D